MDAKKGIKYRNSIFTFLVINQESITDDSWIYYHSPDLLMSRITQQKNFSPYCCPKDKTALTCEVFTSSDEDVWKWPDKKITSRMIDEVIDVGLVKDRSKILYSKVYRINKSYPLYRVGTDKRVRTILEYFQRLGIISTGRQGNHYHTNMDHSIEMGRNAAEKI
jgi:protoporphyrinogen oxidase